MEAGLTFHSTPKLREFLRKVAAVTIVSEKSRAASLKYAEDESVVPFPFLRDVYDELRPGDRLPIHQILAGSSFVLESPKPREKVCPFLLPRYSSFLSRYSEMDATLLCSEFLV